MRLSMHWALCRRRRGVVCARRVLSAQLPANQGPWYLRRAGRKRTFRIGHCRVLRQNGPPAAPRGFGAEAGMGLRLWDGFDFGQHMIGFCTAFIDFAASAGAKRGATCAWRALSALLPATQGHRDRRAVRSGTFRIGHWRVFRQNRAPYGSRGFGAKAGLGPRLGDGFDFGQHMVRVFADVHCSTQRAVTPRFYPK